MVIRIFAAVTAILGGLRLALAEPAVSITSGDYIGVNSGDYAVATDQEWFYLNVDGTPRPGGGGTFDPVERKLSLSGLPAKVVYRKGSTLRMRVTYYNPQAGTAAGS